MIYTVISIYIYICICVRVQAPPPTPLALVMVPPPLPVGGWVLLAWCSPRLKIFFVVLIVIHLLRAYLCVRFVCGVLYYAYTCVCWVFLHGARVWSPWGTKSIRLL